MKFNKFKSTLISHERTVIFCIYLLTFLLLFIRIVNGVGQYWDWSFPYYQDQIHNVFDRNSSSWTPSKMGSPLSYTSDYYINFIVSLFRFIQPENLRYLLISTLSACASFGVYLISRKRLSVLIAFIFGLLAILNPAIFYKYTAGHFDYFVSYALFIFIVYYMIYKFQDKLSSYLILGIMISFVGAQIQFFLITYLFVILFFVFRVRNLKWKYSILLIVLPLLINLVWLSNFIDGGANLASVANSAAEASFKAVSSTTFVNVFTFLFSKATLLANYFTLIELFGSSIVLFFTVFLITKSKKDHFVLFLFTYLLIMIFLSTGLFQLIDVKPFNILYPMFREVGHFAPIIILCSIIIISSLLKINSKRVSLIIFIAVIAIIGINASKFVIYPQAISYSTIRASFDEFKKNENKDKTESYRVLSYPFFGQYTFTQLPIAYYDGLPAYNTGHDSYGTFSNDNFIFNAVKPQDFKTSLQYKLLQTHDVDILKPYNIKYIYDFSGIYQSNVNKYISPSVYSNDISLIKNDPNFLSELLDRNPGKLKRISSHILEVMDYSQHIYTSTELASISSSSFNESSNIFLKNASPTNSADYTTSAAASDYARKEINQLFTNTNDTDFLKNNMLNQSLRLNSNKTYTLYQNITPTDLKYDIENNELSIYIAQPSMLKINDESISAGSKVILANIPITKNEIYYLKVDDKIFPIKQDNANTKLATVDSKSIISLNKIVGNNLIKNHSFENGPWKSRVSDCNNFDNKANISMYVNSSDATDGVRSLELSADKHIACTSTTYTATASTDYLLSFDYKSPNFTAASIYATFNSTEGEYKKTYYPLNKDWTHVQAVITSPKDSNLGGFFIHANPDNNDSGHAIVSYDNVSIQPLLKVQNIPVKQSTIYNNTVIKNSKINATYSDNSLLYKNVISNGTFDNSLWQDKVLDCNNYDINPVLNMSSPKVNGSIVMQLDATRHNACTFTTVAVNGGERYLLKYDRKGNKNTQYGYLLTYNDNNKTQYKKLIKVSKSDQWQTDTFTFDTPAGATGVKLYLYSYEGNGISTNSIQYDNVAFIEIPNTDGKDYLVSEKKDTLKSPKAIDYTKVDNTKYKVNISQASTPFYLNLSETYHPKWSIFLKLKNDKLINIGSNNHYSLNDYSNSWYVDVNTICSQESNCKRNANGTYDISMVLSFTPQRWFNVASWLGALCIFTSVSTIIFIKSSNGKR